MLTEKERQTLTALDDEKARQTELIKFWTIKESIFKTFNSNKYIPAEIETSDYETYSETVDVDGVPYHLAVCGSDISKIRIFKDIIL